MDADTILTERLRVNDFTSDDEFNLTSDLKIKEVDLQKAKNKKRSYFLFKYRNTI